VESVSTAASALVLTAQMVLDDLPSNVTLVEVVVADSLYPSQVTM